MSLLTFSFWMTCTKMPRQHESAQSFPGSIVGVVVAGESYAVYVEARGLDVLTGSSGELSEIFRSYLEAAVTELK